MQPLAHLLLAHHGFQLAHHHRGFLVNDATIKATRVFEVFEFLLNGVAALRAIFRIGSWLMPQQKAQLVIDFGKRGIDNLGSHKIGKNFLKPYVVEPVHGHQIAKPHVGRFVGDQAGATQFLVFCRIFIQHQAGFAVKNRADVLHTAILKAGHEGKIEFGKRQFDSGIIFHPLNGMDVQVKNAGQVALYLGLVGFAVKHGHAAAIAGLGCFLKFARTKGKHIGAEGFGGFEVQLFAASIFASFVQRPIAHGFPVGRNIQMQGITGFQIGLVKTGKYRGGSVRNHQCVQIICAAVERLVAGFKTDLYLVGTNFQLFGGKDKMALTVLALDLFPIDAALALPGFAGFKIE